MHILADLVRASNIGTLHVNHKVLTTGDGARKQGDVGISNFPIPLRDGLVIDVFFACEFMGSSRAPGGWNNVAHHTHAVLQARANVNNNQYSEVCGLAQGIRARHNRYVRSDTP